MDDLEHLSINQELGEWVASQCQEWRTHYSTNYADNHDEYWRLWRGIWSAQDRTRDSERSQLVSPALAQAVESNVAELEAATFQGDRLFDVVDNIGDTNPMDVALLRDKLTEDLHRGQIRPAIGECLINAAVYGTGIGELVVENVTDLVPDTQPLDQFYNQFGVTEVERPLVKLIPIQPRNFLIDPSATSVDDALGCAIEEFVPMHKIDILQEQGIYKDVPIETDPTDYDLEADSTLDHTPHDRVRIIRYYGLVPKDLLLEEGVNEAELKSDSMWQEACVVVANGGTVLKAQVNPYMTQDRPIVAFPWDTVPSRFWGRGVCEKGYSSQKALDAEMRARIDALALTTHPMMAVDATRIPRTSKMEVRPGRMMLTNGDPKAAIMPFNFGSVANITFAQAQALQTMVQQATGAFDGATMAQNPGQEATASGVAMSLGAVIKRQKRTLVNFQDTFLKPLIKKAAHRFMQFSEDYPVKDYQFTIISSLGVVAREYEIGQLSQVLQTLPPGTPQHGAVTKAIIEHLNTSSREEILATIEQASQPNPQAQQQAAQQAQLQLELQLAQNNLINAQAAESQSRAAKYAVEADLAPKETVLKYADADKDGLVDADFDRKARMAGILLEQERFDLEKAERISKLEEAKREADRKEAERKMLQDMVTQGDDLLSQVTVEREAAQ